MKKGGFLLICLFLLAGCQAAISHGPSAYYVLENTWEEIDQATDDVQAAQPIPDNKLVPVGGTTGQVLGKVSDTDNDTGWVDQTGGGVGTLQWYDFFKQDNLADDVSYPWLRPFEDWKITSVVGRTDSGDATIDLVACDPDFTNCGSFLSAPLTLTTAEQTFTLVADGLMTNKRLMVVNTGTATAGEVYLDIHGTYETGSPPSGPSGCDPAVDEIGTREEGDTNILTSADITRMFKDAMNPECSGELDTAYYYHDSTNNTQVRVMIYETTDGSFAGSTLLGSVVIDTGGVQGWVSAVMPAGLMVDVAKRYFVAMANSPDDLSTRMRRDSTTGLTSYQWTSSGQFDNPVDSLADSGYVNASYDIKGLYISIK